MPNCGFAQGAYTSNVDLVAIVSQTKAKAFDHKTGIVFIFIKGLFDKAIRIETVNIVEKYYNVMLIRLKSYLKSN